MSMRTLPLLFLNLGGEMLYILDQRLRAQNIPGDKARKGERLPARTASPDPLSQTAIAKRLYRLTSTPALCALIAGDLFHNPHIR